MKNSVKQFIKFGFVGVSNTIISLGIYYIIIYFDKNLYLFGSFAGFLISVLNSFYWNNKYVFSTSKQGGWVKRLIKTYISYGSTSIISMVLLYLIVDVVGLSEVIAPIITMIVTIPLNFIINKKWAFKNEKKS